jgi:SAM-dependent methyltransferase
MGRTTRARRLVPAPLRRRLKFARLRRLEPSSRIYGFDRGTPIDRYYTEHFLARHAGLESYVEGDVRGRVLELGDDRYAKQFGRDVERLDVLHLQAGNPAATIVGDLVSGEGLPDEAFDCILCALTLHLIYDVHDAVRSLQRMTAPGGVVLATFPGISRTVRPDADRTGDFWRMTTRSARLLFEEAFDPRDVEVEAYGNVVSAMAWLHGLAAEELTSEELDARDPDYEVLVAVRAVKGLS